MVPKASTPFLEPVESVPIQRPQKRVRNPDRILDPVLRNLASFPVNFLNPQIRNKTVENKPREILRLLVQILS